MEPKRRVLLFLIFLAIILCIGVVGYQYLLDVSFVDALYMTVITISTVGYTEVGPMDGEAKLFSIFMIFLSLGTVGYLISGIVSTLMEGDIKETFRRRRMDKRIETLSHHYIICGAGETGRNAISRIEKSQLRFLVIEQDKERVRSLRQEGILVIEGDASRDEVLLRAGIKRAKGLISSLSRDSDNVFVVLTARTLNPEIYIVARAVSETCHEKLKRAGANNVVSPNEIGGSRMASLVMNPSILTFLDVLTHAGDEVLGLEDVEITEESELCGISLRDGKIPEKTGLLLLAVEHLGEKLRFNPSGDTVLQAGDRMIVFGQKESVDQLRILAGDNSGVIHH